jgi:hypothetical protein
MSDKPKPSERDTPAEKPSVMAPAPPPLPRPTNTLPPQHKYVRVITETVVDVVAIAALVLLVLFADLDKMVAVPIIAIIAGAWISNRTKKSGGGSSGFVLAMGTGMWEAFKRFKGVGAFVLIVPFLGACGAMGEGGLGTTALKTFHTLSGICKVIRSLPVPAPPEDAEGLENKFPDLDVPSEHDELAPEPETTDGETNGDEA